MMQKSKGGSKKMERKIIEKNQRIHMKQLCFKLNSLVPSLSSQHFKLFMQESQFDHSIAYIEQLRQRIEVLKHKRNEALRSANEKGNPLCNVTLADEWSTLSCGGAIVSTPPTSPSTLEVHDLDGGLKVLLIIGLERKISFPEIINIVEEGGAEVVKGGYTTIDDKVIYTLHAKARFTRIGIEVTSVHQKLQELIN
ncbi:transcription factor bHLH162-like [Bidens hawaiensis]|uniref:transcription factor bHLH162-like n=1 Tax=Bidens hawaiensis TaxID=980011 RepID=UPI004049FC3A